ncbi:hypothetical protein WDU94_000748 [Cyamophila willieti]
MSPERIEPPTDHEDPHYDIRSDVWSLGITLVELATGEFPYKDCKFEVDVLIHVVKDEPPLLPKSSAWFSKDFQHFISLCLTKDYRYRPKYPVLLGHPFLCRYERLNVRVAEWYSDVKDSHKEQVIKNDKNGRKMSSSRRRPLSQAFWGHLQNSTPVSISNNNHSASTQSSIANASNINSASVAEYSLTNILPTSVNIVTRDNPRHVNNENRLVSVNFDSYYFPSPETSPNASPISPSNKPSVASKSVFYVPKPGSHSKNLSLSFYDPLISLSPGFNPSLLNLYHPSPDTPSKNQEVSTPETPNYSTESASNCDESPYSSKHGIVSYVRSFFGFEETVSPTSSKSKFYVPTPNPELVVEYNSSSSSSSTVGTISNSSMRRRVRRNRPKRKPSSRKIRSKNCSSISSVSSGNSNTSTLSSSFNSSSMSTSYNSKNNSL